MPWQQITLFTTKDNAEALGEQLEQLGAASVTMQDAADQPLYEPPPGTTPLWAMTNVVGLFDDKADMDAVLQQLRENSPEPLPEYRIEELEDQNWERAWMADFQPMRFGQRLWIVPSWHQPPNPGDVNILLDPGLAFGTGTHPTTRLCLEWLEAQALDGKEVIDYGCGSGILAIAAAKLGARHVWGVDNDPQALLATRDNAARNGIEGAIQVYLPESAPDDRTDILIANILAGPLVELAPRLAELVRRGGTIALSGILAEQAQEVLARYEQWFEMDAPVQLDDWVRLSGTKR